MTRLAILIPMAFAVLAPGPAAAHETWNNGLPIPEWVTKSCCGPSDAHHLAPSQVHRIEDGFRIDGYPDPIYDVQVLPSEDGEYWAFYKDYVGADGRRAVTRIFCFFAPPYS